MGGGKGEEEVGAGQGSGSEKEPKGSLRQDLKTRGQRKAVGFPLS